MREKVEIILLETEEEYRQEYLNIFVRNQKFFLWDVPVAFDAKSFNHIFFEPSKENIKKLEFSRRRAKKMYFIKAMLTGKVGTEIMYQPDKDNFAVFCVDLDCVMYLRNRAGTGKLQISTFFDFGKDHTKMYKKQKRKCIEIKPEEFRQKIK
jgi:hypothetical protein